MKPYLFVMLLLISKLITAQNNNQSTKSLNEKVQEAELIFEGRVVVQKSFWNKDSSTILTSNFLVPLKWFKGTYQDTVEILTLGGQVNGRFVSASHTFRLNAKSDYFLFLKKQDATFFKAGRASYFPTSVNYGVVIINVNGGGDEQQDRNNIYNDITNELYKPVAAIVGADYKVFAKNHHEEIIENKKLKIEGEKEHRDSLRRRQANMHQLEYLFQNVKFDKDSSKTHAITAITFDVQIGHVLDRLDRVTSLSLFFNYDTASLGSELIANKQLKVSLADKFKQNYSLSFADVEPGLVKVSISAIDIDTVKLYKIPSEFYPLIHCSLSAAKNAPINVNPNFRFNKEMTRKDGNTFFGSSTNAYRLFDAIYITSDYGLYFPKLEKNK